jgi:hypothetical protein
MPIDHDKTFHDVLLDLPSEAAEGELLAVKLQEFERTPDSESSTLTVCESGQYSCGAVLMPHMDTFCPARPTAMWP